MIGQYQDDELKQLHAVLYELLAELARVCDELGIPYFIIGGSCIGALYDQAILPWDDDIDVGLKRADFDRFVREAPALLRPEYELQSLATDPHSLYFFAKLMKKNTLFAVKEFDSVPMMKGIFVDVFPFDRVPNNHLLQRFQRKVAQFLNCCLMATEQWRWRYFGHCQVEHPTQRGPLACLLTRVVVALLPKRAIAKLLDWTFSWFNKKQTKYYNLLLFPRDHISAQSLENLQAVPFGPLKVTAPADMEAYLKNHYPGLHRHNETEQQNHHPERLSFDVAADRAAGRL